MTKTRGGMTRQRRQGHDFLKKKKKNQTVVRSNVLSVIKNAEAQK